jgi:hypothetical protein
MAFTEIELNSQKIHPMCQRRSVPRFLISGFSTRPFRFFAEIFRDNLIPSFSRKG